LLRRSSARDCVAVTRGDETADMVKKLRHGVTLLEETLAFPDTPPAVATAAK
jgi:hypothetical protein